MTLVLYNRWIFFCISQLLYVESKPWEQMKCPREYEPIQNGPVIDIPSQVPYEFDIEYYLFKKKISLDGGVFTTVDCVPVANMAIIIPYRNRWKPLMQLLRYMHRIWSRCGINYQLFLVQQTGSGAFNKGALMNSAYDFITRLDAEFDAVCFHDVG